MLCRQFVASCRRMCSNSTGNSKTAVVLIHEGQPKTEYYAKDYIKKIALEYYNVPERLMRYIPHSFLINDTIRKCIADYGERNTIEDDLNKLAKEVERALNTLLPEFGRISVTTLFPSRSQDFVNSLEDAMNTGVSRLIVASISPHFACAHTGILLNIVAEQLLKTTVSAPNNENKHSSRIIPNTDISFDVSAIHRWSTHPSVTEYWIDQLEKCERSYDGIVFASPAMRGRGRTEYERSVAANCERIASNLSVSVPWKLGFYNGWNEWPLFLSDSLSKQIKKLSGKQRYDRKDIAIVPIPDFIPNFNTVTVLPEYIKKFNNAFLIAPSDRNQILEHGLAEVIKNHLLGRRNAQLTQYCDMCSRKSCESTRLILA